MNQMVVSSDLDAAFFLSNNAEITRIDLSATPAACACAPLKELGVKTALPTSAMTQKTASTTITDIAVPLTPALPATLVPVAMGTHLLGAMDLTTGTLVDLTGPNCWPEALGEQNKLTKLVVMPSTHTRIAVASCYGVQVLGVRENMVPAVVAVKDATVLEDGLAHMLVYENGVICRLK